MGVNDIALAIFDMEGTLFRKHVKSPEGNVAASAWSAIAQHLGKEAVETDNMTKENWNNGEYAGYVEWMNKSVLNHKEHGLTRQGFEQILGSVPYRNGVKATFERLQEEGILTALVTGGFKWQANRAQRDLEIDHAFAACEYFWNDDGELHHWNLLPADYEGKIDFINLIMEEHDLTPEQCSYVGDGSNDVHIARQVGTSVSFNGPSELQEAATHAVNQSVEEEDFTVILDYLL